MRKDSKLLIAKADDKELCLMPDMANRHGLIAGATGTGKTVSLKVLAESFSDMGVPVFLADVKGDLTGFCTEGNDTVLARAEKMSLENFDLKSFPVRYWDLFGENGTPIRATISDMGPMFLSRLLNLTPAQTGVLNIVFRAADDAGLLLHDLKDLRAMLAYVGENRMEYSLEYGTVSTASVGAIQRALLAFEDEGATEFFGDPGLDIRDLLRTDMDGRGYINVLSAQKLISRPMTYSTFLLWMLSELFEQLPEVGDVQKPRIVFFFDEAHLIFSDCPKELRDKIAQTVKLIRSKGVGIYFISQNPSDIPGEVLSQLSNRIQHALHAYTPAEQKGIKAAVQGFRVNPAFDTEVVLSELGVGEALVSFLDEEGVPGIVEKAKILPPQSLMGPAPESDVSRVIACDEMELKYRDSVDPESAYEVLMAARQKMEEAAEIARIQAEEEKQQALLEKQRLKEEQAALRAQEKAEAKKAAQRSKTAERAINTAANTITRGITTNLINSVTGGRTTSTKTIGKRAATNAINSVVRSTTGSIIRGLFGNKK
ncbi:MAG: DUF853 family protein [Clostridia bacterium]|nr:DUF853 family protein [Clostridia bacterium]